MKTIVVSPGHRILFLTMLFLMLFVWRGGADVTGLPTLTSDANEGLGVFKWRLKAGGSGIPSSPAIGPDGTIYFGSNDGYLYALSSSSKGLAKSSWPMFRHDQRHTGLQSMNRARIIHSELIHW